MLNIRLILAAIAVVLLCPAVALAADGSPTPERMIELNTPEVRAALLVAVPVLLFVARLLARPSMPLPAWADITTWPRWAQPIVPFVLAAAPPLILDLQSGVDVLAALQAAGASGFGAIGLYHAAKRVVPPAPPAVTWVALVGAVGGCHVVTPAANLVDLACANGLQDAAEVIDAADTRGIPVKEFAAALCELPDVVHAWNEAAAERSDPTRAAVAAAQRAGAL